MEIKSRRDWEAEPARSVSYMTGNHNGWFWHWPGTDYPGYTTERVLQRIQGEHISDNGWSDIGYSWAIDQPGDIWECRGSRRAGDHTKGYNSTAYGVLFIVGLEEQPSMEAIDAFQRLRTHVHDTEGHPMTPVRPHSAVSPGNQCPGDRLRGLIESFNDDGLPGTGSWTQRDLIAKFQTTIGVTSDGVFGPDTALAAHQAVTPCDDCPDVTEPELALLEAIRALR